MQEFDLESMEPRIIKTQDENGEIHNFELIDVMHIDNQDYGLLVYLDENEEATEENAAETSENDDEDDEDEVIIMRLNKEDDVYTFETIEDDDEFNKVVSFLEAEGDFEFDEEEDE